MHRRRGCCEKHSITAENSTPRDSLYIKEGFRLRIRFVETGLGEDLIKKKKVANGETGRGREIVPKTEQLRKIVKV